MFMHNGGLSRFSQVRRSIRNMLSSEIRKMIIGTTDSEHIGALFYQYIHDPNDPDKEHSPQEMKAALQMALYQVVTLVRNHEERKGKQEFKASSLNFAVSNGKTVIVTRYRNSCDQYPPSLFYCPVKKFSIPDTELVIESDYERDVQSITTPLGVLISSEPLTEDQVWIEMQPFTIATIEPEEEEKYKMRWDVLSPSPTNEEINELLPHLKPSVESIIERPLFVAPSNCQIS
eukprot:TRINITY_DN478_c0_g1_i3.p1 TRINITY_DN478_c0_g1~~TRINITY_DN478_c0_g1_i3.p1  ORF type:complete len:232 (+),score=42.09 TRINITY_DN478_c0_g1_i3:518-1213(+)